MTDLEIARECGADVRMGGKREDGTMFYPATVTMMHAQFAAFADRIRAQQREKDAQVLDRMHAEGVGRQLAHNYYACAALVIRSTAADAPKGAPKCPRCGLPQAECDAQKTFPDPEPLA